MKKRNYGYPEETEGSKIAKRCRKIANKLTAKQREELLKQGMSIIYGGNSCNGKK